MNHEEFVVLFKNGEMDWVDPVNTVVEQDGVIVVNNCSYDYHYDLSEVERWVVRPYNESTTYDPI